MRIRLSLVAFAVAALGIAGLSATSANAAANNACPTSPNGAGEVLNTGMPTIDLMVGDYLENISVLKEASVADIVCASAPYRDGFAGIGEDGTVIFAAGRKVGSQNVNVGAVKDGTYYATTFTVNVFAVDVDEPTVTQKLARNKPATIKFTNTTSYTLVVSTGDFKKSGPDVVRWIAPGKTLGLSTKRTKLDFVVAVELGSKKVSSQAGMIAGSANTRSGTVSAQKLYYSTDPDGTESHHMQQSIAAAWGK